MLIGIDNALNAEVLYVLRAMGHGDELVVCDTNFPADSVAQETTHGDLLRMENLTAAGAIKAILSVFPLDSFVDHPAERMEVMGKPKELLPVAAEVQAVVDAASKVQRGKDGWPLGTVERFAFYERAKKAYAVVVTGERRFYGCFILKKGVIPPEA
jgi:L-fucose mutarotase